MHQRFDSSTYNTYAFSSSILIINKKYFKTLFKLLFLEIFNHFQFRETDLDKENITFFTQDQQEI